MRKGPGDGEAVGEEEEEPERGAGAFVAGGKGMRRGEEAGVSEEAVRRRGGGGGPREFGNEPRVERPGSPCEMRGSRRQVEKDRSQFFVIGPDGSEET